VVGEKQAAYNELAGSDHQAADRWGVAGRERIIWRVFKSITSRLI